MRSTISVLSVGVLYMGTIVAGATGEPIGVPAGDPYAVRKVFYEHLWQAKIESALKYVDGAVVCVNVELAPHVSRTIVNRQIDNHPIKEAESTHVEEHTKVRPQENGAEKSTVTKDSSYSKNLVSQSESTTQYAGLTPTSVSVTVTVPTSYYEQVRQSRQTSDQRSSGEANQNQVLAAIEQEISARIEETVVELLPPSPVGRPRVRVSTFDNRQEEATASIVPNPTVAATPEVITLVFDSSNAVTSSSPWDGTTLRAAALVTEILPNGNLRIESQRTIRDGGQMMHQKITGRIRPESLNRRDRSVKGDEIADLRIDTHTFPATKTTAADPDPQTFESEKTIRRIEHDSKK